MDTQSTSESQSKIDLDLDSLLADLDGDKQANLALVDQQLVLIEEMSAKGPEMSDEDWVKLNEDWVKLNAEKLQELGFTPFVERETYLTANEQVEMTKIAKALDKAGSLPQISVSTQEKLDIATERRDELTELNAQRRAEAFAQYFEGIKQRAAELKIALTAKRQAIESGDSTHPLLTPALRTTIEVEPENYEKYRDRKFGEMKERAIAKATADFRAPICGYAMAQLRSFCPQNFQSEVSNTLKGTDLAKIDDLAGKINNNQSLDIVTRSYLSEVIKHIRPLSAALTAFTEEVFQTIGGIVDEYGHNDDQKKSMVDWVLGNFDNITNCGSKTRILITVDAKLVGEDGKLPEFFARCTRELLKFAELKELLIAIARDGGDLNFRAGRTKDAHRAVNLRRLFESELAFGLQSNSYNPETGLKGFDIGITRDEPQPRDAESAGKLHAVLQAAFGGTLTFGNETGLKTLNSLYPLSYPQAKSGSAFSLHSFEDDTGNNSLREAEAFAEKIGTAVAKMNDKSGTFESRIEAAVHNGEAIQISSVAEAQAVVGALQKVFGTIVAEEMAKSDAARTEATSAQAQMATLREDADRKLSEEQSRRAMMEGSYVQAMDVAGRRRDVLAKISDILEKTDEYTAEVKKRSGFGLRGTVKKGVAKIENEALGSIRSQMEKYEKDEEGTR